MPSLVWKPSPDVAQDGPLVVRQSGITYRFYPGVPRHVRVEHFSAVQTALAATHSTLASPAAPTITRNNTAGTTTRYYKVVATGQGGDSVPSTATSNATLNATPNDTISWTAVTHAASYSVLVSTDGGVTYQQIVASVGTTGTSFTFTGTATQAYTAAGAAPNADAAPAGPAEM